MTAIRFKDFQGMVPRLGDRALAPNQAVEATYCKLWSKELRSWTERAKVATPTNAGNNPLLSIYRYAESGTPYWVCSNVEADFARGPIAGDTVERTYVTQGSTAIPKVFVTSQVTADALVPAAATPLGMPIPTTDPVVASVVGGAPPTESRSYVYTYVASTGEEGAPSDPTVPQTGNIDATWTVTLPTTAPTVNGTARTDITTVRLYRTNTGTTGTNYQFVADVALATGTYADAIAPSALGEILPTEADWGPPPSDMAGIISLPGGVLAGFTGNELCFSAPGYPYLWPLSYRQTTDFPIVAIGNFGTTVVVATTGNPYLAIGSTPAAVSMSRRPERRPCVSKRSLVSSEHGVSYATPDGYYVIGPSGSYMLTEKLMTHDEWQAYYPASMHAAVLDGRVFLFYHAGGYVGGAGFIIDPNGSVTSSNTPLMTELSFYAYAQYVDYTTGTLWLATVVAEVFQIDEWEGGSSTLQYSWKSGENPTERPINFAFGQVFAAYTLSAAEQTALDTVNAAILVSNTVKINNTTVNYALDGTPTPITPPYNTKGIGGGLGSMPLAGVAVAGNILEKATNNTNGVSFQLYGDGVLRYVVTVGSKDPFRLPGGYTADSWSVGVSAVIPVKEVVLATDLKSLKAV
jgi:hypothetical protein